MKLKITLLSILFIFIIQQISTAQITEENAFMSQGEHNAFTFDIESTDIKGIEKEWKKYFKDYGKVKKTKKEKEWYSATPVELTNSSMQYTIYFKVKQNNDVINAYIWANNGTGFVSSQNNGTEAKEVIALAEEFAHISEVYVIESILDEEDKALGKLEKELRSLEKKNDKYHKKIADAKETISKNEISVEQNVLDQADKNRAIQDQKKIVKKVEDNLSKLK